MTNERVEDKHTHLKREEKVYEIVVSMTTWRVTN